MPNTSDEQNLAIPDAVEMEDTSSTPAPTMDPVEEAEAPTGMAEPVMEIEPEMPVAEEASVAEVPMVDEEVVEEKPKKKSSKAEAAEEVVEETHEEMPSEEDMKKDASERALRLITAIERDVRELRTLITGQEISYGANPGASFSPKTRAFASTDDSAALSGFMTRNQSRGDEGIDGAFDGERMIDTNGKTYPVPPNYASKSKLVEGDPLKLYIAPDGKFVFKQLGPIQRRTYQGTLIQDGSHYIVTTDEGATYSILTACVTYHMALYGLMPGGRVQIMVPADRESRWAVIDAVI